MSSLHRQSLLDEIVSPILRDAYTYWLGKCRGCRIPSRADIDPVDIPRVLANTALIERDPQSGRLRFRVIGTALTDALGWDATGRFLDEIFPDYYRSDSSGYRDAVFRTGEPSYRRGRPLESYAKDFTDVERLYLPLAEDGKTVTMILSIIDYQFDALDDGF